MAGLSRVYAALGILAIFVSPCVGHGALPSVFDDQTDSPLLAGVSAVQYTYRNYTGVRNALLGIVGQHSDIAELIDIGDSWEKVQGIADRDILAIKISDNVAQEEDEPEVLILALHHAREWSTSELALMIADNLTDSYKNDSRTSWLVDNREIWIVPVVNPDGLDYALAHDQWWRKNRHHNSDGSYGVDLNRNYDGAQNGDPLGAWGGAGSSNKTTDETYHGEYAFSEPETQAVRDLVLEHHFSIALDLHSYGQWVMWPWGYTNGMTEDDADLQRIGRDLAALNGYFAAQSIELYPTTGDSLDWLYGAADIYAFCFEVGYEFHPMKSDDVGGIIRNNIPPSKLAIDAAGDRENRSFTIAHVPSASRAFNPSGFELAADVTADRGVNSSSVVLRYRIDGQAWKEESMSVSVGNDTYSAAIPPTTVGSKVDYFFVAKDMGGVQLMSPVYAPYELYSFVVSPMDGGPIVSFAPPSSVEGSTGVVLSVNITNITGSFEPILHLENISLGVASELSMITDGYNYSCEISPGHPLGEFRLWLTIESNSTVMWSSEVYLVDVDDELAPLIGEHSVNQVSFGLVEVLLNCSDVYGVESVDLVYKLDGVPGISEMSLLLGSVFNGTWTLSLDVGDAQELEYSFAANDSRQESYDPDADEWHQLALMQQVPEMPYVGVIAGIVAVAVISVIARSRRG